MRILSSFPFLLVAWAMSLFAYQSFTDNEMSGMMFNAVLATGFICWAIYRYVHYHDKQTNTANILAINIGLLPLLYANLILMPIVLQGRAINESGMIYVLVLIYSPMLYGVSLITLMLIGALRKRYFQTKESE